MPQYENPSSHALFPQSVLAPNSRAARWISALTLILIGVIGLAVNFNLLTAEMLNQLWKAWPVIPLVYGIAIVLQHKPESGEAEKS